MIIIIVAIMLFTVTGAVGLTFVVNRAIDLYDFKNKEKSKAIEAYYEELNDESNLETLKTLPSNNLSNHLYLMNTMFTCKTCNLYFRLYQYLLYKEINGHCGCPHCKSDLYKGTLENDNYEVIEELIEYDYSNEKLSILDVDMVMGNIYYPIAHFSDEPESKLFENHDSCPSLKSIVELDDVIKELNNIVVMRKEKEKEKRLVDYEKQSKVQTNAWQKNVSKSSVFEQTEKITAIDLIDVSINQLSKDSQPLEPLRLEKKQVPESPTISNLEMGYYTPPMTADEKKIYYQQNNMNDPYKDFLIEERKRLQEEEIVQKQADTIRDMQRQLGIESDELITDWDLLNKDIKRIARVKGNR